MMISPETYISFHKKDSFDELIEERNRLIKEITDLEKIVFDDNKSDDIWQIKPGPDVRYQLTLVYLAELCKFMSHKYNREVVHSDVEYENEQIHDSSIEIKKIGITKLDTDAIVNAANEGLQAGGGVCGAIFREAGSAELTKACNAIGGCKTGNAVITPGFDLPAKYIIHAVGPVWNGGKQNEPKLLYSAYKQSLLIAKEHNCHSIGFPLISAGIFGYPKDQAWRKAIQACQDFIKNNSDYEMKIVFAVLDDEIKAIGERVLNELSE
ncbi:MAG: macro domain-containing protein [Oscillospiraceae bacterium]